MIHSERGPSERRARLPGEKYNTSESRRLSDLSLTPLFIAKISHNNFRLKSSIYIRLNDTYDLTDVLNHNIFLYALWNMQRECRVKRPMTRIARLCVCSTKTWAVSPFSLRRDFILVCVVSQLRRAMLFSHSWLYKRFRSTQIMLESFSRRKTSSN